MKKLNSVCPCGNERMIFISRLKDGRGKYCSKKCMYLFRIRPTGLTYIFIKENHGRFKKGEKVNDQHHNWKGESVGYGALHRWVYRKLGSPSLCEKCGVNKAKRFEWANISREYKRDLNDWMRLCSTCHGAYDTNHKTGAIERKYGYKI